MASHAPLNAIMLSDLNHVDRSNLWQKFPVPSSKSENVLNEQISQLGSFGIKFYGTKKL